MSIFFQTLSRINVFALKENCNNLIPPLLSLLYSMIWKMDLQTCRGKFYCVKFHTYIHRCLLGKCFPYNWLKWSKAFSYSIGDLVSKLFCIKYSGRILFKKEFFASSLAHPFVSVSIHYGMAKENSFKNFSNNLITQLS